MIDLADTVLSLVAPDMCIGCGSEGSTLCDMCLMSAGEPLPSRCAGCKTLAEGYRTCRSCRAWLDIYAVYVATEYSGLYERLLKEYKFHLHRKAVGPIVRIMLGVPAMIVAEHALLVPMPTAPSRIRARGFDHAKLLARKYLHLLSAELRTAITLRSILRRRSNSRQLGSSREQRIRQVANEFYVPECTSIQGETVILFDDVTTTGASLAAAARVLKNAGAERVYAIVYAQKV